MQFPATIIHADWSVSARKRWSTTATLREDGRYYLSAPRKVRPDFVASLLASAQKGCVLAGFDFPIGLPWRYGQATGFKNFRQAVIEFGRPGPWAQWFDVAEAVGDLSIHRPFYPLRPGGTRQAHLIQALDVKQMDDLRRVCERRTGNRGAACSLFWTLGGNQVGKAAISGWREIIVPALRAPGVSLWPFDGELRELLANSSVVIAETYPAEAYRHVAIIFRGGMSKRRPADRASFAATIQQWAEERGHDVAVELREALGHGFGDAPEGEDMFDAVLGLCGMLEVATGRRAEGHPPDSEVGEWEGWILGQADEASRATRAPMTTRGHRVPIRV